MTVIKRNGSEVTFDITKIIAAITKANESVDESIRMTPMQIQRIAESVEFSCLKMNRSPSVEEIQDLVEYQIMAHGAFEVAKNYVTYRYTRSLVRRSNTTDEKILSLIECCNEEAKQENANKNPVVNSTQRDYMAGEVSRDITERILLPQEIVEAHREGIITRLTDAEGNADDITLTTPACALSLDENNTTTRLQKIYCFSPRFLVHHRQTNHTF